MTDSRVVFRAGTRRSRLAIVQTKNALERIRRMCPGIDFELVVFDSPGDRDKRADLKSAPADVFTRDLDEAVLNGDLDCAVHSAKDLPYPPAEGLDWFWLPWRAERRDVIVLPKGATCDDIPAAPRIGVSSDRREQYARRRFPQAELIPLRGNIEDRLAKMDAGEYDAILMAAAALERLQISEYPLELIPLDELMTPEGQGALAVTFRRDDPRMLRLRSLFVKPVVLAGAGVGTKGNCTLDTVDALVRCEVCYYDALLDDALLEYLPNGARHQYVGKRSGSHSATQDAITRLLAVSCRQGQRVVRLKGGDSGIFGRLAEEIDALEAAGLPYSVLAGVSSLSAATTGTGMLLTRRGLSRGFSTLTPRLAGGAVGPVTAQARGELPCVFFMGIGVATAIAEQLLEDGSAPETPVAAVFAAGSLQEEIVHTSLQALAADADALAHSRSDAPGLLIVGDVVSFSYHRGASALRGERVLVTSSDALQGRTCDAVRQFGGTPVALPLIRMVADPGSGEALERLSDYDWLVLTSPAAVRAFGSQLSGAALDVRTLPKIIVAGPGTARELATLNIVADLVPAEDYGTVGILGTAADAIPSGARLLRLRSDAAGTALASGLEEAGYSVDDVVLYANAPIPQDTPAPAFDTVFFASGSAVDAFVDAWDKAPLEHATIVHMGTPTARALASHGLAPGLCGIDATVDAAITALAVQRVLADIENMQ